MNTIKTVLAAAVISASAVATAQTIEVDAKLPSYKQVSGISGKLDSKGSDTLDNLMNLWSESFQKVYPGVTITHDGKGSSTAPPALIEGTAQLGPMSRAMKDSEIDAFEKKYGFKPTKIGVALDALAVYVHKDNPVEGLDLAQVDAIFSKTRKSGATKNAETWGDVGVKGEWARLPISMYGRNSASGTYGYFKKKALFKGDYKDGVKEQPGSAGVVQGVTNDKAGIGYSGIGYKTSGVKAISLGKDGGDRFEPTYENVLGKKYPLGRLLYIYVAKKPNEPLDPNTKEFIKYVLSKEGQEIVAKDGYLPLPAALVEKQLQMID